MVALHSTVGRPKAEVLVREKISNEENAFIAYLCKYIDSHRKFLLV